MTPRDVPEIAFSHNSREVALDRPKAFRELREKCPVVHSTEHDGYYLITGWDELESAARNTQAFSSDGAGGIPPLPLRFGMSHYDPPGALKFRRELSALFTPGAAEKTRLRARELVHEHIDKFIERGSVELISELTGPVPAMITMEELGVPLDRCDTYASLFHDLFSDPEAAETNGVAASLRALLGELEGFIEERRREPRDDWMSALLATKFNGEALPAEEVLSNAHLFLTGGIDTTTQLTSWTVVHLATDLDLKDRLRADRSLLPKACEEFLRYVTPFQGTGRTVTEPVDVCGWAVRPPNLALLAFAGANRDPRRFDNPDQVDIDRPNQRHMAFGDGIHKCIGMHLARVWFEEMLGGILDRIPDYVVDEARMETYRSGAINGIMRLPLEFPPGPQRAG